MKSIPKIIEGASDEYLLNYYIKYFEAQQKREQTIMWELQNMI